MSQTLGTNEVTFIEVLPFKKAMNNSQSMEESDLNAVAIFVFKVFFLFALVMQIVRAIMRRGDCGQLMSLLTFQQLY